VFGWSGRWEEGLERGRVVFCLCESECVCLSVSVHLTLSLSVFVCKRGGEREREVCKRGGRRERESTCVTECVYVCVLERLT